MKIIDRYILKQFIQIILFGLLAFILLFIIIDLFEKLDDFIDKDVAKAIIFKYYFVSLPEITRLILPVSVLLAGLFTIGNMVNHNELTALKAGGLNIYRFMAPFVVFSFLLSLFAIYFGGFVVPNANKEKIFIEQTYMKKGVVSAGNNVYFQDTEFRIVTISFYDTRNNQANRVSIQEFDSTDVTKMVLRIDAHRMKYDADNNQWILLKGTKRRFVDSLEFLAEFDTLKMANLNFSPDDVIKKQTKPEEMTITELADYAEEQTRTGNNPTRIEIEYHSRFAFAFSSFVIILFGLPIAVGKKRGGLAIQFGINLLIAFSYLVLMKLAQSFGKNGVFDPVLTAWSANAVFFTIAIINLYRIRK